MNTLLEAKVILVVGGSAGIGRATALALARAGASVVIADVDTAGGHGAVDDIACEGGQACFLATDVRDSGQIQHSLDYVMRYYGRLDGAFNNAGTPEASFVSLADLDMSIWDRVMAVNLRGLWLCMKHEIPLMQKQGGGVIVNHASMAGLSGNQRVGAADVASKHGVLGLTRAAALEYANQNIRIHAVCSGIVDGTFMGPEILGEDGARAHRVKAASAAPPVGTVPDVTDTVVRLFSGATSFVTRNALPIDGSLLAQ